MLEEVSLENTAETIQNSSWQADMHSIYSIRKKIQSTIEYNRLNRIQ
jgi:hypothetical protein